MADQKNDRTYSVDRYNGKGQWDGWSQANPNGGVDHYNGVEIQNFTLQKMLFLYKRTAEFPKTVLFQEIY